MSTLAWSPARVEESWRMPIAVLLGLISLILLAYRETGEAMVGIWIHSETFTHAFVVPPIVAWLVWRKKHELARLKPKQSNWMLIPLAGFALLWWLGHLVNVAAATQLALVAMLVATVPLVMGWAVTRVLAFPLAFLFFAVPIGEFMTPTLMHWTAEALVAGLRLTGIPVYQEGQQLVIPSGRWAVVEACSGVRYLMATFMVGSLFAYLNYASARKRLVFVAISLVLPILANWVRAYIIVMLGHLSNNEIATGADHLVYGWVFFGIVIVALFFIGARWADPDDTEAAAVRASRQARDRGNAVVASWRPISIASLAALVAVGPLLVGRASSSTGAAKPVLAMPSEMGAWREEPLPASSWRPGFVKATVEDSKLYRSPKGEVTAHIAYYRGQIGDVKLISSSNRYIGETESRWHVLAEGEATVPMDGRQVSWRRATLGGTVDGATGSSHDRITVWRIYWLGGPLAHGDVYGKLRQAWQALNGQPDDGAVIHLASDLPDHDAAERQLVAFVNENFTMLERTLKQTRDRR